MLEYQGSGVFQPVYSSNYTSPTYSSRRHDFSEGLLVLWKKACGHEFDVFDYSNGGTLYHPVLPDAQLPTGAAFGRFVYQWEGANSDDDHISMWRTNGQIEDVVPRVDFGNEDYCNPGDDVVAIGGPNGSDIVVYDYDCRQRNHGLYYWDRATNPEGVLSTTGSASGLRMNGYGAVWLEYPGPHLKYAFFKQPELAVAGGDIASSDSTPVEGAMFDVMVTVRNVSDVATGEDVVARLYFGDPEQGGGGATGCGADHSARARRARSGGRFLGGAGCADRHAGR